MPIRARRLGNEHGGQVRHQGCQCRPIRSLIRCDRCCYRTQVMVMPIESPRHGIIEVAQELPPIADLDGIRSPTADAVGIAAGAITGNDLSTGMILQPGRNRVTLAVRQQVDRPVALQIDDDGAVALAPPPRPVIDADDARRCCWFYRHGPDQAQQRVAADRHGEPVRQAGAGFTAGMQSDAALRCGEADGPPNPRQDHFRQLFSKDPTRAPGSGAAKAADLKIEMADTTLPGKISEMPDVSAMYPARAAAAQGTGRCGGASTDPYDHAIRVDDDLLNRKAGWEQGQQRIGHGEDSTL
jgi:hypothetical protein